MALSTPRQVRISRAFRTTRENEEGTYTPDASGRERGDLARYPQQPTRSSACRDPTHQALAHDPQQITKKARRWNIQSIHRCPDTRCRNAPVRAYRAYTPPSVPLSMRPRVSLAFVHGRLCGPIRGFSKAGEAREKGLVGGRGVGCSRWGTYMNKWAVHFEPGVFRSSWATAQPAIER